MAICVAFLAVACSGQSDEPDEVGGTCQLEPGVVCRDQDLRGVSMVGADLRGADFAGSDLRSSDLRNANLTDANLTGASLGGVDLAGALLVNADMTRANLFFTNLTGADLTGAIQTEMFSCNVTQPNGALIEGECPSTGGSLVPTAATAPTGPPTIDYFRLEDPPECLNDAAGTGINVEWSAKNVTTLSFSVDGIRIEGSNKARGRIRLPFVCDGTPHTATMRVFGAVAPGVATSTITTTLDATNPISSDS